MIPAHEQAGVDEQAAALAGRLAGVVVEGVTARDPLGDPAAWAGLLHFLWEAGAHEQAAALAGRAAAHADLDNPSAVAFLLDRLSQAGAHEQAAALLARDPAGQARDP